MSVSAILLSISALSAAWVVEWKLRRNWPLKKPVDSRLQLLMKLWRVVELNVDDWNWPSRLRWKSRVSEGSNCFVRIREWMWLGLFLRMVLILCRGLSMRGDIIRRAGCAVEVKVEVPAGGRDKLMTFRRHKPNITDLVWRGLLWFEVLALCGSRCLLFYLRTKIIYDYRLYTLNKCIELEIFEYEPAPEIDFWLSYQLHVASRHIRSKKRQSFRNRCVCFNGITDTYLQGHAV
jgi:hypothetical protein